VAQKKRLSLNSLTGETTGAATILHVAGSLTGSPVSDFERAARLAVGAGHHLVLDLAGTTYLGADALGALIHLGSVARRHDRELWLTGLRPFLYRLIQATQLQDSFRIAPKVADALRRMAPAETRMCIEAGANWAVCRIGGRFIPLDPEEAEEICTQILEMIEHHALHAVRPSDLLAHKAVI
jgi:anti-anti-sigma factor